MAVAVVLADSPADVIAFALEGENDAYDVERLRTTLDALPDTALPPIIDLGRATFIDSAVVSVLLEHAHAAASGGRAFAVFLPETAGEYVRRLIETTRLHSILPLHEDWDEMLASVEHPRAISASLQPSVSADRQRD